MTKGLFRTVQTGLDGADAQKFTAAALKLRASIGKRRGPNFVARGEDRFEVPLDDLILRRKEAPKAKLRARVGLRRSQRVTDRKQLQPFEEDLLDVAAKAASNVFRGRYQRRGAEAVDVYGSVVVVEPGAAEQNQHRDNELAVKQQGKTYETFLVHVPGDKKQGSTRFVRDGGGGMTVPKITNWQTGYIFSGDVVHFGEANAAANPRLSLMFVAVSRGFADSNREFVGRQCPLRAGY